MGTVVSGYTDAGNRTGNRRRSRADSVQCRVVHFGGTVQGVGFRFSTRGIAESFAVAGFVGRVRPPAAENIPYKK